MKKTNLFIALVSIIALASCNGQKKQHVPSDTLSNSDEKYHFRGCQACDDFHFQEEHKWVLEEDREPTCTTEGVTAYSCECGAFKKEVIGPLGHIPGETYYIDANGHHTVCSRPGCIQRTKEGAHDFKLIDKLNATCELDGYNLYQCECGLKKNETLTKTGHKVSSNWNTNADIHNKVCSICGTVVESGSHNYVVDSKEATCTEGGYTNKECSVCGYKSSKTTSAKGHDISTTWVKNEDGHYKTCSRCDEHFDASAHNFKTTETKESTCISAGYIKEECKDCGYTKTTALELAAHTPGTFIDDGEYHVKKCTVCQAVLETKAHEYVNDHKDATCTEAGHDKTSCSVCGNILVNTTEDAKGHDNEYSSKDAEKHIARCKTCGTEVEEAHTLTTREIAGTVSNCAQTITECSLCEYENVEYTGPHEGGHLCSSTDPIVEIDEQKCGRPCKIPGCTYVQTSYNHTYSNKKILSYPHGDIPGTEQQVCKYCKKRGEISEFSGTKVDSITVTIPVMPRAGMALKDWWSYTVDENVSTYTTTNAGVRIQGLFIRCSNGDMYGVSDDLNTVLTEEQLSGPYQLYFYFNNAEDTYWEWDNVNMVPVIELTLNNQYHSRIYSSGDKMSGYWAFAVNVE